MLLVPAEIREKMLVKQGRGWKGGDM